MVVAVSEFRPPGPTEGLSCHTDAAPEKVTAYLTVDQNADLESLKTDLLRQHRLKTSKTTIVQAALAFIVEDYRLNGEASWIFLRLAHLQRSKTCPQPSAPPPQASGL